ncbi:MAG: NAD-dependent DNA ligase LigA [Bacilli bacterium]
MNKRMKELYEKLEKYSYEYHHNNNSLVSDYDYDQMFAELKKLENQFPDAAIKTSVTSSVGDEVDNRFSKVVHNQQMLSLDNVFNLEELRSFDQTIRKLYSDFSYVCELKIDGLAMSFIYEDGTFIQAVTRGNGIIGEDVTHNIMTMDSIKKIIDKSGNFEVRGEVYISKSEFESINLRQKVNGKKEFANPRNLAAGTIRQLDSNVTKDRKLDAFIYSAQDSSYATHYESLMELSSLGFNINKNIKLVKDIEAVIEYVSYWENNRSKLPYETDGIVIKINEYDIQKQLGYNSRAPKWAIAYKYKAEQVLTRINNIVFQVGRTGKITPVANLDSVNVSGSVISRATLHNESYIIENDIRKGDTVLIHKAGEIIPEVVEVITSARTNQERFKMIQNCPVCGSILKKEDANHFCKNELCDAKNSRKLGYFASIDAMNIEGLGTRNINIFYELGIINKISDIYELHKKREVLINLSGFGQRSIDILLDNIEKSKNNKLEQFITGLGIKHVGKKISKVLVNNYNSLEKLSKVCYEELVEIDEIGDVIAKSFIDYISSEEFESLYKYLKANAIEFKVDSISRNSSYTDKVVCVTGIFSKYKRKDIEGFFTNIGAKVTSSVSKNTNYLIAGDKAGSKLDKAKIYETEIIDEERLIKIMGENV